MLQSLVKLEQNYSNRGNAKISSRFSINFYFSFHIEFSFCYIRKGGENNLERNDNHKFINLCSLSHLLLLRTVNRIKLNRFRKGKDATPVNQKQFPNGIVRK